jgi:hypothetical protein
MKGSERTNNFEPSRKTKETRTYNTKEGKQTDIDI